MKSVHALLLLYFLLWGNTPVYAQPDCTTVEYIESVNRSVVGKRVIHLRGRDALLFVALDPYWSMPDFENIPHRHPGDMAEIRAAYQRLLEQGVDEVVVWPHRLVDAIGLPAAFHDGCAIREWGEPDDIDKLMVMQETVEQIAEHGVEALPVRNSLGILLDASYLVPFDPDFSYDPMIDVMLDRIRPLVSRQDTDH